ncbi:helix-hairpin-helix domain-containing protein [Alteribacter aurantiacus]|uniref:helix-hairpin-helix domain-containing protein n=1 Tax=Alteribacter aurantiacus TaxID=254410 RepID=UPI000423E8D2|nr:helix-hairpin-helix domain-containing protein [Alteribacter aurantiacus]
MADWHKYKPYLPYLIGGTALIFFLGYHFMQAIPEEAIMEFEPTYVEQGEEDVEEESVQVDVYVDVKGAVKQPGVYMFPEGARIQDAISKAGGMVSEADEDRVNLAQRLQDEMVVYIPVKGEEGILEVSQGGQSSASDLININTATQQELETLPGIGPSKAQAILSYVQEHGPFSQVDDITNVPGIGAKSFETLETLIRVK